MGNRARQPVAWRDDDERTVARLLFVPRSGPSGRASVTRRARPGAAIDGAGT